MWMEKTETETDIPYHDFIFWTEIEWLKLSSPFLSGYPISIIFPHPPPPPKVALIWYIIYLEE